jgi:hypothetical protein
LLSADAEMSTSPYFVVAHGVGLPAAHSIPPCVAEPWIVAACSLWTDASAPCGTIETHAAPAAGQLLPRIRLDPKSIRPGATLASAEW